MQDTSADPVTTSDQTLTRRELGSALRSPAAAIDVLLAQRQRWTATVMARAHQPAMTLVLLVWGLAFTLPYALVLSPSRPLQVALLFAGSALICLPSLHVVGAYVGLRVTPAQSFALGAIGPAVAAIFSLGFAPILWFLDATIDAEASPGAGPLLSTSLLSMAALAGAAHVLRCLALVRKHGGGEALGMVVLVWLALLLFITYRMARLLELT